jgi:hypothetical protein
VQTVRDVDVCVLAMSLCCSQEPAEADAKVAADSSAIEVVQAEVEHGVGPAAAGRGPVQGHRALQVAFGPRKVGQDDAEIELGAVVALRGRTFVPALGLPPALSNGSSLPIGQAELVLGPRSSRSDVPSICSIALAWLPRTPGGRAALGPQGCGRHGLHPSSEGR